MTTDNDPPLTKAFLIQSLESQIKMHDFMAGCDYGSPSHRTYVEGLKESSAYMLRRLNAEDDAPPKPEPPRPAVVTRPGFLTAMWEGLAGWLRAEG